MTEAAPQPASQPAPKPVETPAEKPAIKLPVALIVALVGLGLLLFGSFLAFYDGIPGDETPKLFNAMSGKVAIILVLVAVLLVAIKRFVGLATIAASLALGGVLGPFLDAVSGDNLSINLANAFSAEGASAGIGMYAALFGSAIVLLAVFMMPKKKDSKKK